MSNVRFVHLPSNSSDYPDNGPNKFRVRLPTPLRFDGTWTVGLHSITFAYSWPSTLGTLDDQAINVHYGEGEKQQIIRIPVPKASHTRVEELRDFLAATLKHQSESIESISKAGYEFIAPPKVVASPARKKRSANELKSPPRIDDGLSSPPRIDEGYEDDIRKKARLTGDLIEIGLVADAIPPAGRAVKGRDLVDDLFGSHPKEGEKNRAGQLLDKIGLGSDTKTETPTKTKGQQMKERIKGTADATAQDSLPSPPRATPTEALPVSTPTKTKGQQLKERVKGKSDATAQVPLPTPPAAIPTEAPAESPTEPTAATKTKGQQPKKRVKGVNTAAAQVPLPSPPRATPTVATPVTPTAATPATSTKTKGQQLKERVKAKAAAQVPSAPAAPIPKEQTITEKSGETALKSPPRSDPLDAIFGPKPKEGEKSRAEKFLSVFLPDRKTSDALDLNQIRKLIDSIEFQYHKDFDRFKAVFKDSRIKFISLSAQLGYVLGFENSQLVVNNEIAKYGCDLRGGFSSFAVYSKGLIEPSIIGNSLSSLLRVVSVTGVTPGEYTEKIYDSPIYARVLPREVAEIEIELRTMDNGRLVPFSYGTVMLVLIFKKTINF